MQRNVELHLESLINRTERMRLLEAGEQEMKACLRDDVVLHLILEQPRRRQVKREREKGHPLHKVL